jgi:serine/threonine-protein kinase
MRFQISADSVEVASECCGFQIAVGPDERRIFFVGASRGRSRLYVRDVDDLAARPVAGSEGAVEVAVSSDGQWLAFRVPATDGAATGGDFELRKVPAVGGTPLLVARTTGFPYGMTWTDDDVIVYASQRAPLHRVAAAGGLPVPIAHTDSAISPRFVRGGVVLYSTVRFGPGRVRRLSLADGEVRDLTEGSGAASVAGYLVIERGGSLVAQRYDARTGGLAGPPTAIAGDIARATDFSVSEQGMLAFGSGSTGGVLASVDRRGLVALLPIRVEGASHFDNPNYSPDGRFLAVAAGHSPGHELFVIDIARGTSLRMTFSGGTEFADWTPDGRALVYQKDDTLLAMQPADRSAPERILLSTGKRRIFRISVAGGWIAYAVAPFDSPHGSDIHLLPLGADRSADRVYQATPYGELAPALSPDGRWMAYVSDESGRDEVYLSSVPVAAAREPISTAGGREPVWDRDGRTLYYRTPTGDLVAVTLGAGARPTVVARTILPHTDAELSSDGADFAAQPRGGGFLMMRSRTSDLRIVVETDALARLRDRRR